MNATQFLDLLNESSGEIKPGQIYDMDWDGPSTVRVKWIVGDKVTVERVRVVPLKSDEAEYTDLTLSKSELKSAIEVAGTFKVKR